MVNLGTQSGKVIIKVARRANALLHYYLVQSFASLPRLAQTKQKHRWPCTTVNCIESRDMGLLHVMRF